MEKEKNRGGKSTKPMIKKKDVAASNDPKINEDHPGFPHHPATEESISSLKNVQQHHQKDNVG